MNLWQCEFGECVCSPVCKGSAIDRLSRSGRRGDTFPLTKPAIQVHRTVLLLRGHWRIVKKEGKKEKNVLFGKYFSGYEKKCMRFLSGRLGPDFKNLGQEVRLVLVEACLFSNRRVGELNSPKTLQKEDVFLCVRVNLVILFPGLET
ncbi:hypothetical protein CEXT_808331 [Caerostris extrusa]|uniref:Uncharacterized protein n=1 Tax=Caerostris extrusa TaxID=172846 RepID=A0AAV4N708_CAEEX|nr:hypothetical protein CEXT_808331 [Caerostris extrusa]